MLWSSSDWDNILLLCSTLKCPFPNWSSLMPLFKCDKYHVNHFMLIMSSKLKELVVNNTPSIVHLDFAHISAFPACFSGPLQQLNFIRKTIDGKLHILNVYVDMENNVCPKNIRTRAFTFCLKYLLSSLWCGKAGRVAAEQTLLLILLLEWWAGISAGL